MICRVYSGQDHRSEDNQVRDGTCWRKDKKEGDRRQRSGSAWGDGRITGAKAGGKGPEYACCA